MHIHYRDALERMLQANAEYMRAMVRNASDAVTQTLSDKLGEATAALAEARHNRDCDHCNGRDGL